MLFTLSSTTSESFEFVPCFIDEPTTVGEESAVDRVEDRKLSQSLDGKEQHESNDHEPDELEITVSHPDVARFLVGFCHVPHCPDHHC